MIEYLEKVLIENFQAHNKTILQLSRGLNVIFGESDQGKSSIIRAIRWVITNRPLGDSFRKHNTKRTSVTLKRGNDIIRRRKTNTINDYKVNTEKPHKAPRASVPEDISMLLNMSEDNIQAQHETYFLVHNTPGQRSKTLNEVAGLEIMDKTLADTNSEIRGVSSEIKFKKQALEDTEKGLKKLNWVESADTFLTKLDGLKGKIDSLEYKRARLQKLIQEIEMYEDERENFLPAPFVKELYAIIAEKDNVKSLAIRTSRLKETIKKIEELRKSENKIRVLDVNSIKKLYISLVSLQNKRKRIQRLVSDIEYQENEHMSVFEMLCEAEANITNKLDELGICPTCKQPFAKGVKTCKRRITDTSKRKTLIHS
jgi:exonuclease SbcC